MVGFYTLFAYVVNMCVFMGDMWEEGRDGNGNGFFSTGGESVIVRCVHAISWFCDRGHPITITNSIWMNTVNYQNLVPIDSHFSFAASIRIMRNGRRFIIINFSYQIWIWYIIDIFTAKSRDPNMLTHAKGKKKRTCFSCTRDTL